MIDVYVVVEKNIRNAVAKRKLYIVMQYERKVLCNFCEWGIIPLMGYWMGNEEKNIINIDKLSGFLLNSNVTK